MHHRLVNVPMGMRFADRAIMRMLMMFVMRMTMLMRQLIMTMFMTVPLGKMEPETDAHQDGRQSELQRHGLAQQADSKNRADEGRESEIGAGARRPEIAQRQNEHDKADTDTEEPDNRSRQHCR